MIVYDAIILGLGGIGSAIAERLSRSGQRILGLERYGAVHDLGSSHGETRAIRQAYFEDPRYVPIVLRAYELWREFEERTQASLLFESGCVILGPHTSSVIQGCLKSARTFHLEHEQVPSESIAPRFNLKVESGTEGFFEPHGGYLLIEKCRKLFVEQAIAHGATLKFDCRAISWRSRDGLLEVNTDDGTFFSRNLVIATGAWLNQSLSDRLPLTPKRTVQFWFEALGDKKHPTFFFDDGNGTWIYGFPAIDGRIKVAFHSRSADCDPDTIDRAVSAAEVLEIERVARPLIPELGKFLSAKACIYEMTPDEHFLLGKLEEPTTKEAAAAGHFREGQVIVAAGFSGHGFKFAPVIGEIVDDLLTGVKRHDIELFNPQRFK